MYKDVIYVITIAQRSGGEAIHLQANFLCIVEITLVLI